MRDSVSLYRNIIDVWKSSHKLCIDEAPSLSASVVFLLPVIPASDTKLLRLFFLCAEVPRSVLYLTVKSVHSSVMTLINRASIENSFPLVRISKAGMQKPMSVFINIRKELSVTGSNFQ